MDRLLLQIEPSEITSFLQQFFRFRWGVWGVPFFPQAADMSAENPLPDCKLTLCFRLSCFLPSKLSGWIQDIIMISGVRRGLGGFNPPPRTGNIFVEKWCYFRRVYFCNKCSHKSIYFQFFYWILIKNIQKLLEISTADSVFVQTRENLTKGFEMFFAK